ncbi:MAG: hypothetical protein U0807_11510 [Candidatus Binatia bacterium]
MIIARRFAAVLAGILVAALGIPQPSRASSSVSGLRVHPLHGAPRAAVTPAAPRSAGDPRALAIGRALAGRLQTLRAEAAARAAQQAAIRRLADQLGQTFAVHLRPQPGTPRAIEGGRLEAAHRGWLGWRMPDEETARAFLRANAPLLRLADPDRELGLVRSTTDALGRTHLRFAQRHADVPVWPSEVVVHLDPDGNVDRLTGTACRRPATS